MILPFYKYQGAGNDFIIIEDENETFPIENTALTSRLCNRYMGVGADGILLMRSSKCADSKMLILNADGSHPSMCGNGLRCFIKHLSLINQEEKEYSVETNAGIYKGKAKGNIIQVQMNIAPQITSFAFSEDSPLGSAYSLNTGVPHLVFFTPSDHFSQIDVKTSGYKWRHHPHFSPDGTNVNFATVTDQGIVAVRTYERGVEDETMACGTGCVATALVASHLYSLDSPIKTITRSNQELKVSFEKNSGEFTSVALEGEARMVFKGVIEI